MPSSFELSDAALLAAIERATLDVKDYPEDTIAERVTSAETSIDRLETNLAYLAVIYGCAIGILATLAVQHIFGAA